MHPSRSCRAEHVVVEKKDRRRTRTHNSLTRLVIRCNLKGIGFVEQVSAGRKGVRVAGHVDDAGVIEVVERELVAGEDARNAVGAW